MSTVSGLQANTVGKLNENSSASLIAESEKSLGKTAFLELMIAQLKNQDPLNPQDNSAFVAQLAQFSTVEGIQNLNESMATMSGSFASAQALQASALVGRSVLVPGDQGEHAPGNALNGFVSLPQSTSQLNLKILSPNGELIRQIPLGLQEAGDVYFDWDGIGDNGQVYPAGNYKVQAEALLDGEVTQVETFLAANVNSVTLNQGAEVSLNVAGIGAVPLSQVRTIN